MEPAIKILPEQQAELELSPQALLCEQEDLFAQLHVQPPPFQHKLSFAPLLRHLEEARQTGNSATGSMAAFLLDKASSVQELWSPIESKEQLAEHKQLIELLLLSVLPAVQQNTLVKVSAPFELSPIYTSPALQACMDRQKARYILLHDPERSSCGIAISACAFILNTFYGQQLKVEPPFSIAIKEEGQIERRYKVQLNTDFIEIKKRKPLLPLSQAQINQLLSNIYDLDLWMEHLPPENFEFQGFAVNTLVDITEDHALSEIKYALLERDAVFHEHKVKQLEKWVRTYLNLPELRMGLTAIDYPPENAVNHRYKIRFDFLAQELECLLAPENYGSIYEKACRDQELVLVEDIKALEQQTPIEAKLLEQGIRSIIVAPLLNKYQQVIGLLEIGAPKPFDLHSFVKLKFKEITGLFSMAVERSRDEIDNRIEAIIREQYTAIHPSIEWKFIENAYELLEERERDPEKAVAHSITFKDVHPLYAQADIVDSSVNRNQAIQEDLTDNLRRLCSILTEALRISDYPLLDHYCVMAERNVQGLNEAFNSNDESRIVEWLQIDIHPMLEDLQARYPQLNEYIQAYFEYIDPNLGIVYRKRKAYEQSVAQINGTIARHLDQQQAAAQQILPHYFERYKTDGVEYNIYAGQSMLKKGKFHPMHLRNLRLWQLIGMCRITELIDQLQDELPLPLTTAQLIFVYSNALSIRFRMDDKKFDVDGAYNVRYEILKKRIDKALVEGTNERLTQSGKIAIVYLQERDRLEYLEYADYLIHKGWITNDIEDLAIGKLQGVHGLRALRLTVAL